MKKYVFTFESGNKGVVEAPSRNEAVEAVVKSFPHLAIKKVEAKPEN